jgi:DNA repair protein RadA/Sms
LALLVAVLEKRMGLNMQDKDVFLNVVGGVKVVDPAADLPVMIAVASALLDKVVPFDTVLIGEVGLSSEVRSVSQVVLRINEAERLGFKRCIMPKNNLKSKDIRTKTLELVTVTNVREALDAL